MEQESRAGCILHGCGVLAALAGLCAASGAACVFALTPGWRVWALPVFFLLALAGAACGLLLYAAGSALQILCDIRGAVKDKLRRNTCRNSGKVSPLAPGNFRIRAELYWCAKSRKYGSPAAAVLLSAAYRCAYFNHSH